MTYEFVAERELPSFNHFDLTPVTGALGGLVSGIDLTSDLPEQAVDELYRALLEFKVLFFRDQPMDEEQHLTLARRFGTPQGPGSIPQPKGYPMIRHQQYDQSNKIGADINFHADDTFRTYPSKLSILRGLTMPQAGGDTIWVDMEKAFAALSEPTQKFIEGLTAEHSLIRSFGMNTLRKWGAQAVEDMMKRNPPVIHPVVTVHPETGRKSIYVNQLLTSHIIELTPAESDNLLNFLFQHSYKPDFECRFHWEDNSVAFWDNRSTQHRGIGDFHPAFRLMQRIPLADDQRPSFHPEREEKLDFGDVDFIRTEELFDKKPEMVYEERTA